MRWTGAHRRDDGGVGGAEELLLVVLDAALLGVPLAGCPVQRGRWMISSVLACGQEGSTAPGSAGHEAGAEVDAICRSCGRKARGAAAAVAPSLDYGWLQDDERRLTVPCTYEPLALPR